MKILAVGVEPSCMDLALSSLMKSDVKYITNMTEWEEGVGSAPEFGVELVLCGSQPMGVQPIEVAQTFRSLCPTAPVFYLSTVAIDLRFKELLKNGFQQIYYLPSDSALLKEGMASAEKNATGTSRKVFRSVSLVDIGAGDPLEFDVSIFLPLNNKYVKVLNSGKALTKDKIDRFNSFQVSKIFIDSEKLKQFYSYSAKRLKAINSASPGVSETERMNTLRDSIRKLTMNIFDMSSEASYDEGRKMMEDVQNIVAESIGLESVQNVHSELSKALNQPSDAATRANRVSTFAALFEMVVGLKKTQQAAIAGLFLDIGLSSIPAEVLATPPEKRTDEQKKIYNTHADLSLKLLQGKRMVVPPEVQNAILQHHERLDGSGPNGIREHKLSALSQVVALADRFVELVFESGARPDLDSVIERIRQEKICTPEILSPIATLVRKERKAA